MKTAQPTKSIKTREIINKLTGEIEAHPTNKLDRNSTYINRELDSLCDILSHNPQMISKVQLFKCKPYTMFQFYNWRNKFPNIPSIQNKLKKIDEILESNLIDAGMSKNPAFPIFMLKNNYGYTDQKQVDNQHTVNFTVTRGLQAVKKRKTVNSTTTNSKPTVAQ
jgi:hypothetical protein